MPRPIEWYQLYRGKVWHLMVADAALCGNPWRDPHAERTQGQPPTNAHICMDCHTQATELRIAAELARQGDPRSVARDVELLRNLERATELPSETPNYSFLVDAIARRLASLEPNEPWPTNEELGGSLTGTRDDEYRHGMNEQATEILDDILPLLLRDLDRATERPSGTRHGLADAPEVPGIS